MPETTACPRCHGRAVRLRETPEYRCPACDSWWLMQACGQLEQQDGRQWRVLYVNDTWGRSW
jgi:transposase-like protein